MKNIMLLNRICLISLLSLLSLSCANKGRNEVVYLYSKDKSQVVSVFSNYDKDVRFIVDGKFDYKPDSKYYKIDISNVTELGDEIGVCWRINGNEWEIVNDNARIIEVKIDSTRYIFKENWNQDERGIPNAKYYRMKNCYTVDMLSYTEHFPKENGSVERFN
ncbi:hypothetical protein [Winogradskyella sp.]|uniref:hypothetical protein n=1 Tax=Winogradskyella sp. TaxID=1883156 RepID=UPI001B2DA219|nr:hypothetical protein [Winogradskyella sp.]MBO6879967.1 hypothetical protein [Winogradskyella sp.]